MGRKQRNNKINSKTNKKLAQVIQEVDKIDTDLSLYLKKTLNYFDGWVDIYVGGLICHLRLMAGDLRYAHLDFSDESSKFVEPHGYVNVIAEGEVYLWRLGLNPKSRDTVLAKMRYVLADYVELDGDAADGVYYPWSIENLHRLDLEAGLIEPTEYDPDHWKTYESKLKNKSRYRAGYAPRSDHADDCDDTYDFDRHVLPVSDVDVDVFGWEGSGEYDSLIVYSKTYDRLTNVDSHTTCPHCADPHRFCEVHGDSEAIPSLEYENIDHDILRDLFVLGQLKFKDVRIYQQWFDIVSKAGDVRFTYIDGKYRERGQNHRGDFTHATPWRGGRELNLYLPVGDCDRPDEDALHVTEHACTLRDQGSLFNFMDLGFVPLSGDASNKYQFPVSAGYSGEGKEFSIVRGHILKDINTLYAPHDTLSWLPYNWERVKTRKGHFVAPNRRHLVHKPLIRELAHLLTGKHSAPLYRTNVISLIPKVPKFRLMDRKSMKNANLQLHFGDSVTRGTFNDDSVAVWEIAPDVFVSTVSIKRTRRSSKVGGFDTVYLGNEELAKQLDYGTHKRLGHVCRFCHGRTLDIEGNGLVIADRILEPRVYLTPDQLDMIKYIVSQPKTKPIWLILESS